MHSHSNMGPLKVSQMMKISSELKRNSWTWLIFWNSNYLWSFLYEDCIQYPPLLLCLIHLVGSWKFCMEYRDCDILKLNENRIFFYTKKKTKKKTSYFSCFFPIFGTIIVEAIKFVFNYYFKIARYFGVFL